MLKKLIFCLGLLLTSFVSFSQENTASPYSYYGLGELRFKGTQEAKAMGGLAITGDSLSINLNNPASYSHLFVTTFSVGGTSTFNNLKTSSQEEKAKRTSFDYLAIGIPMGKLGAAFGLMPYSSVGYKLQNNFLDSNNDLRTIKQYGTGNINRVFTGLAYSFSDFLSFGANLEYNFGKTESKVTEDILGVQLGSREINEYSVSGVTFNFGALYSRKIDEKKEVYSSITYSPQVKLNLTNYRQLATITYTAGEGATDFTVGTPIEVNLPDSKLIVPSRLALGLGIGEMNKWLLGAEVSFVGSKNMVNRFGENGISDFENGQKYVLGGYYIPKYDSFSSYLSRVVYRAGFRYEKTGLIVNNKSINDYGMNFGLGLPVGVSKIDLSFEFGKRGTTSNNLIQENYFNIGVGLSLGDKWFKKTLID